MNDSIYDNPTFFAAYSNMDRSVQGLKGAGEWHQFKPLLPDFHNASVLDLGCGFGWHCNYAHRHGATHIVGVDNSKKMLTQAKKSSPAEIEYKLSPLESYVFAPHTFDVVLSSLVLHYIQNYETLVHSIYQSLTPGGIFIFSVEHPIFTSEGSQDWLYAADGTKLSWPVDNYFSEGPRNTSFLGTSMRKYHRTLATYIQTLLSAGFTLLNIVEAHPSEDAVSSIIGMADEMRRPMMLIIKVQKEGIA